MLSCSRARPDNSCLTPRCTGSRRETFSARQPPLGVPAVVRACTAAGGAAPVSSITLAGGAKTWASAEMRTMFNDPEWASPDEWDAYAWFGFAVSEAQAVESELLVIATALSSRRAAGKQFDAMWSTNYNKLAQCTFGQLLAQLRQHQAVPDDLVELLAEAVKRRNYLAHEFYWPHCRDAHREVLPEEAKERFMEDASLFRGLATRLEAVMFATLDDLHMRREDVAAQAAKALSSTAQP